MQGKQSQKSSSIFSTSFNNFRVAQVLQPLLKGSEPIGIQIVQKNFSRWTFLGSSKPGKLPEKWNFPCRRSVGPREQEASCTGAKWGCIGGKEGLSGGKDSWETFALWAQRSQKDLLHPPLTTFPGPQHPKTFYFGWIFSGQFSSCEKRERNLRKICPKVSCIKFFWSRDAPTRLAGHTGHSLYKTTEKGTLHKVLVRDIPAPESGINGRVGPWCPRNILPKHFIFIGTGKRGHYKRGLFTGEISRPSKISKFSRISRKWPDPPLFSTVWDFSKISRISKFTRISRKLTFLKRPLSQKTPFSEPDFRLFLQTWRVFGATHRSFLIP